MFILLGVVYLGPQSRQDLCFMASWEESLCVLTFRGCLCSSQLSLHLFTFPVYQELDK